MLLLLGRAVRESTIPWLGSEFSMDMRPVSGLLWEEEGDGGWSDLVVAKGAVLFSFDDERSMGV